MLDFSLKSVAYFFLLHYAFCGSCDFYSRVTYSPENTVLLLSTPDLPVFVEDIFCCSFLPSEVNFRVLQFTDLSTNFFLDFFFFFNMRVLRSRSDTTHKGHLCYHKTSGSPNCFTSSHDLVYLEQIYFNKVLMLQYNSTLEKFEGYTKKMMEIADDLNKSKRTLDYEKNSNHLLFVFFFPTVEPSVRITPVERQGNGHQMLLVCSAYDFYPKQIKLTWLRNGEKVVNDVTSTEELSNRNWLYQIHSYLEYTPSPGEELTCMVEHASLKEPKYYNWEPTSGAERNKIAVGTSVLLFGFLIFVAGLLFYKRKSP
uniref:Ig-like domain-containing protein n=1 Tax=Oryzias melastigma TaxID=30732 RepID=A0A3B3BG15_ORYME